jgi:hypothetical protein
MDVRDFGGKFVRVFHEGAPSQEANILKSLSTPLRTTPHNPNENNHKTVLQIYKA